MAVWHMEIKTISAGSIRRHRVEWSHSPRDWLVPHGTTPHNANSTHTIKTTSSYLLCSSSFVDAPSLPIPLLNTFLIRPSLPPSLPSPLPSFRALSSTHSRHPAHPLDDHARALSHVHPYPGPRTRPFRRRVRPPPARVHTVSPRRDGNLVGRVVPGRRQQCGRITRRPDHLPLLPQDGWRAGRRTRDTLWRSARGA